MPFAVFVIAHAWDDDCVFVAATTRDDGSIGLPGGKVDMGETPVEAAIREAAEEGWLVKLNPTDTPVHTAMVDGKPVWWYAAAEKPSKLQAWKEMHRGIKPVWITESKAAQTGFGNGFIAELDFDLGTAFRSRGLSDNFDAYQA